MLERIVTGDAISVEALAATFRTTREEPAESAGLGRDAVLRKARAAGPSTQRRYLDEVALGGFA